MQVSILGEGKYELNEKEKSAFAKAKEFLIDLFSYIPKDASDEFIAHQIRLIWDKNYAPNEDGDFFADLNDDIRLSVKNPTVEQSKIIAKAREAMAELIETKKDKYGAIEVPDIGLIDFLWGKPGKLNKIRNRYFEGFGISHIIAQRNLQGIDGEALAMQIPEILILGKIVKHYGSPGNKRVNISYLGKTVVIKKEGGSNHWIITAFVNNGGESSVSDHSAYAMRNPEISSAKGATFTESRSQNVPESQDKNNPRFSVRANPSSEEIAEARRQKEEVKAKWTNPDGSMKKGYMLAPNGEPTKLSEDQWLMVRTPNFKRWFGDWETLAEYEFLNGKSIRDISTKSVPSGGFAAIREWAAKIFERQGGVAKNSILGDVILDKASVRDSLAHGGANLYKSAAFEVAKDVIEKGYLIFNDVNKGRDSYYFAAPINIDGVPNIVVALVHKYDNDNRFYLHSVGTKESLLGNRVSGLSKDKSSNTSTTYPRDYLQALQNIFNVKPEDVSKVVDENGEPLVVYHGTRSTSRFNVFKGSEHFFSDNREVADGFLNGTDYALEINGETYPISRRDMEALADIIMGDSAEYDSLVGDWEAGELSYEGAREIISDITHNEYTVEALSDFPLSIKVGGRIVEAFLNIRNPIEIDYGGKTWQAGKVMPEQDLSEHPNADGLIGRNIREGGLLGELRNGNDFPISTDYVVRNSNQIKSATDNVGTFSNSPDIRFSVRLNQDDIGKPFEQVRSKIPFSGATPPPAIIKRNLRSFETEARDVEQWLRQHSIVTAFDNRKIRLSVPERDHRNREALPNLLNRAKHLIGFERGFGERQLDEDKLRWVKNIPQTLQTAQARFVSPDAKKLYYVKNYNGILHIVIINKRGSIEGQLITHFPQIQKQPRAFLQEAVLDAINYEGMANLKIGESVPPKRHKEVQTGQTPNLSDRAQYSDFNPESQDKNNPRFSVRANPQKNKKTLALILAPDILKSDGKITQEIRNTAARYAPNLSKKDLQEAIDNYSVLHILKQHGVKKNFIEDKDLFQTRILEIFLKF